MSAASTIAPANPLTLTHRRRLEPTIVDHTDSRQEDRERRGSSQCMQALARANEVRLARAALKREIAAGHRRVTQVVIDSPWEAESMSLSELLCSQRRWGRARSRKLLSSAGLNEAKRLGTLTARQQKILVGALEAKLAAGMGQG
jgi:hypothetical protein